jgi:hypothetical protein
MRRFVTLAVLLLFTIPFGVSISGCSKGTSVTYCNGSDSGVQVGQTTTLSLSPQVTGISLNQGQIGSIGAPTGKDCRGNVSSVTGTTYASTNITLVDVNPATGSGGLCAGTWNRNTGAGIPDYTVCTPNGKTGIAYITASAQGVVSNPVAIYVHPIVTSIVLGAASTDCANDPASNCFGQNSYTCTTSGAPTPVAPAFSGNRCISQGAAVQLAARAYAGTGSSQSNISCLLGPVTFSATTPAVVTIGTNGLATAAQPGSTTISAVNSQASSTAGFFNTCPPASIVLSTAGSTTPPSGPVSASQNVTTTLVATVTDTAGQPITNIPLQYISTTPTTIPTSSNNITPTYPGSAAITAVCQPPTCNTAPFNLIGLYGNGTPVTSEPVQINATGTGNSTILYMASTNSQFLLAYDFTLSTQPSPSRLPYPPNSLVLSEDGTTIYMGSANELMTYSTSSNAITKQDNTVSGSVLAISPDNSTLVITDPVRQLTYLYAPASGSATTEYGGVGTAAQFSNDSSTVYITTNDGRMLVHNTFTGWTAVSLPNQAYGVAPTVPNAGVYLAGNPVDVYTNCPNVTVSGTGLNQTTTIANYPPVGPVAGAIATNSTVPLSGSVESYITNNIASTNDGLHVLAASVPVSGSGGAPVFTDIGTNQKSGACPVQFTSNVAATLPFSVAAPTAITGVLPTSDSAFAFVTYTGTGGVVPQYVPATKTLSNIPLQTTSAGAPVAPVAGVVGSDNQTFYVGTSGDNLVHLLTRGASGFSDTTTPINPALPAFTGSGSATPNLLAQKPIKATS